jgi:leucyl aminopeptidase
MIVQSATLPVHECNADALILALGADWENSPTITELDRRMSGQLSRWIQDGEILTKPMKTATILSPIGLQAKTLILVGLGNPGIGKSGVKKSSDGTVSDVDSVAGVAFRAAAAGAKIASQAKTRKTIAYAGFGDFLGHEATAMQSAVAGSVTGGVGQDLFKAESATAPAETILWYDVSDELLQRGKAIGESMSLVKRLVNLPPNYLYPESFVQEAVAVGAEAGFQVEVWDESKLIAENCNSLLAVSKGSTRSPRLCIMRYAGNPSSTETSTTDAAPIALVGKGVTFDSGGYSLKPTDGMLTMKCDMAGAATVLGILRAAALLKIRQPIIGLVGLVENMVAGNAMKLGDVLTARSGKTIEVHNTDAEGRLVLADVLNVALDYSPSKIIDFATLTGACCVALGNDIVGVMSNNNDLQQDLLATASNVGEYAWPLPMFPYFSEQIAGKVADIKNVGEGRWGGAITAAKFLEQFVDEKPWVHLDIAGPAFLDSPKSWCDAGGTATMVRTIVEMLSKQPD